MENDYDYGAEIFIHTLSESETLVIIWKRADDCLSKTSIVENLKISDSDQILYQDEWKMTMALSLDVLYKRLILHDEYVEFFL